MCLFPRQLAYSLVNLLRVSHLCRPSLCSGRAAPALVPLAFPLLCPFLLLVKLYKEEQAQDEAAYLVSDPRGPWPPCGGDSSTEARTPPLISPHCLRRNLLWFFHYLHTCPPAQWRVGEMLVIDRIISRLLNRDICYRSAILCGYLGEKRVNSGLPFIFNYCHSYDVVSEVRCVCDCAVAAAALYPGVPPPFASFLSSFSLSVAPATLCPFY